MRTMTRMPMSCFRITNEIRLGFTRIWSSKTDHVLNSLRELDHQSSNISPLLWLLRSSHTNVPNKTWLCGTLKWPRLEFISVSSSRRSYHVSWRHSKHTWHKKGKYMTPVIPLAYSSSCRISTRWMRFWRRSEILWCRNALRDSQFSRL